MGQIYDDGVRNAILQALITEIGASPALEIRTGAPPSDTSNADSGTMLCSITLPATWMSTPSGGQSTLAGTWAGTGVANGVPGHFRIKKSGVVKRQGKITVARRLVTSASTPANGNVLTFASTTGLAVNMQVSGIGVPTGATIAELTATTVKLSLLCSAGLASGAAVYFGDTSGQLWMPDASISVGGAVSVLYHRMVAPGG